MFIAAVLILMVLKKRSATYSTSGTTVLPSLISVVLHGKCSMGNVFDVFFFILANVEIITLEGFWLGLAGSKCN